MDITTTPQNTWKVMGHIFGEYVTVFESPDLFKCIAFVADNGG
jgi:hypothetical protein